MAQAHAHFFMSRKQIWRTMLDGVDLISFTHVVVTNFKAYSRFITR